MAANMKAVAINWAALLRRVAPSKSSRFDSVAVSESDRSSPTKADVGDKDGTSTLRPRPRACLPAVQAEPSLLENDSAISRSAMTSVVISRIVPARRGANQSEFALAH